MFDTSSNHAYHSAIQALRDLPQSFPVHTCASGIRIWIQRSEPVFVVKIEDGRRLISIKIDLDVYCLVGDTVINLDTLPHIHVEGNISKHRLRTELSDFYGDAMRDFIKGLDDPIRFFTEIYLTHECVRELFLETVNFEIGA